MCFQEHTGPQIIIINYSSLRYRDQWLLRNDVNYVIKTKKLQFKTKEITKAYSSCSLWCH